jgi:hypothetical protein
MLQRRCFSHLAHRVVPLSSAAALEQRSCIVRFIGKRQRIHPKSRLVQKGGCNFGCRKTPSMRLEELESRTLLSVVAHPTFMIDRPDGPAAPF